MPLKLTEIDCWSWMLDTTSSELLLVFNKRHQSCPVHIKWIRCAMKPHSRSVMNVFLDFYSSADFRCGPIGWIPSKDLQVNQASCFKLPAYLYATKQFTPLPQRSLLPLKSLYDKYDDSIQPRRHLLEHFFSISFLSERWISLSFRLTFCYWHGLSQRKLQILFRALILMDVSIEQYLDVSSFRKWEERSLLITRVRAN